LRVQPRRSMGTNGAVAVPAVVAVENGEPLSPAAQAGPIYGACRDRTGDLRLATHPDTRPHLTVTDKAAGLSRIRSSCRTPLDTVRRCSARTVLAPLLPEWATYIARRGGPSYCEAVAASSADCSDRVIDLTMWITPVTAPEVISSSNFARAADVTAARHDYRASSSAPIARSRRYARSPATTCGHSGIDRSPTRAPPARASCAVGLMCFLAVRPLVREPLALSN
jgi:hypothetical protein